MSKTLNLKQRTTTIAEVISFMNIVPDVKQYEIKQNAEQIFVKVKFPWYYLYPINQIHKRRIQNHFNSFSLTSNQIKVI